MFIYLENYESFQRIKQLFRKGIIVCRYGFKFAKPFYGNIAKLLALYKSLGLKFVLQKDKFYKALIKLFKRSLHRMWTQTTKQISAIQTQLANTQIDPKQSLIVKQHVAYLKFILKDFREAVIYFDVAQPWLYYYCIHSLNLMAVDLDPQIKQKISQAIRMCENQGYAGGYKQLSHLAPTYASFLTILELGKDFIKDLNKERIYAFFKKIKIGGKFMMHQLGQCDMRGSYIVAIITKFLGLNQDILEGVAETILASQTPQGGISNVIGGQAHGGFTFCGVAALAIMGKLHELDVSRLMLWLSRRQVQFGGFNGRTNKLIDSCYSFWIGSIFNVVNDYFQNKISIQDHLLYCQQDLQKYILLYCQQKKGGLTDKPGKLRDCYHTCYALSGLSLSQQFGLVLNQSKLTKNDPIYNVCKQRFEQCKSLMKQQS